MEEAGDLTRVFTRLQIQIHPLSFLVTLIEGFSARVSHLTGQLGARVKTRSRPHVLAFICLSRRLLTKRCTNETRSVLASRADTPYS